MKSALKVAAWSALYFAGHSALSSFGAKNAAARLVGRRQSDGFYRLFYCAVALLGLAALFFAARRLPDRKWYHARSWGLLFLLALQVGAGAMLFTVVKRARALRILGVENALGYLAGEKLDAAPDGQIPPANEISCPPTFAREGALALSRHAINFWVLPIFWAWPRMTRNYAVFCAVTTLYCALGSWFSEARQRARYGADWARYKRSGTPFFLPQWPRKEASSGED